ncbi:MAG: hypothetical protein ACRDFT_10955 [bacterium]
MKGRLALVVVGLLAWGLAGCAAPATQQTSAPTPVVSEGEIQTLRERTAAYWAARMAGDDHTQWELLEPRGRGRMTAQEYAAERRGVRYLGYQVEEATIEGYFAKVKVRLLVQPIIPRLTGVAVQTVLIDDRWVRIAGMWYRTLDERAPQAREP